ncbi:MAG: TRAP transporter substrate-binding protein DctP [Gemmobacter sp.]
MQADAILVGVAARLGRLSMAGVVAGAIATAAADAQTLRYAVGLPESNYNYDAAVFFADELREKAGLNVSVFALSLLSLNEIPGGVRDGLADFGLTLFPYFPAEYSEVNLPANLAMLATSGSPARHPGPAMIGASIEYILLNCPDCLAQMKQRNAVFISGGAAVEYGLVCSTPVPTLAALRGKTVRTGTADHGRFVEHFGGTQIAMSGNEIYDALNSGNIDCSANTPENLISLRYVEIADSFTHLMPGSMFAGIGSANMNRDSWARLTQDQRRAVLTAGARMSMKAWTENRRRNLAGLEAMEAAGKPVYQVSAEDRAAIDAFVEKDIGTVAGIFTNTYGVRNVDEKVEIIRGLVEKWKGLTNAVEADIDALADLYIEHVYSKVDVATYGLD